MQQHPKNNIVDKSVIMAEDSLVRSIFKGLYKEGVI
jgi:hypothetical protein